MDNKDNKNYRGIMFNFLFRLSVGNKSSSFWHGKIPKEKFVENNIFININKSIFSITWDTGKIIDAVTVLYLKFEQKQNKKILNPFNWEKMFTLSDMRMTQIKLREK